MGINVSNGYEPKVSQRGVVVFRAQDDVDTEMLKRIALRLGELTGRPSECGLHIHPFFNNARDGLSADNQINTVSSEDRKKVYHSNKVQSHNHWHSDIGFEAVPGDYSVFIVPQIPETGGGTYLGPMIILTSNLDTDNIGQTHYLRQVVM